jgi:hypothetical protein
MSSVKESPSSTGTVLALENKRPGSDSASPTVALSTTIKGATPKCAILKRQNGNFEDNLDKALVAAKRADMALAIPNRPTPTPKLGDDAPFDENALHSALSSAAKDGIITIHRRPKTTGRKMARDAATTNLGDVEFKYQGGAMGASRVVHGSDLHSPIVIASINYATPSLPVHQNPNLHVHIAPSQLLRRSRQDWEGASLNGEFAPQSTAAEASALAGARESDAAKLVSAHHAQTHNRAGGEGTGDDALRHGRWMVKTPQGIALTSVLVVLLFTAILVGVVFVVKGLRKSRNAKRESGMAHGMVEDDDQKSAN